MPLLRFRYLPLLLLGLYPFLVLSAQAQVVIRERVEVHPDSTSGVNTAPPPMASAWPGGVRGKGTFRFKFAGALLRAHPLSSLSATLTTTKGRVYELPLASAGTQTGERTVCRREGSYSNPDWPECTERTYSATPALLVEFPLDGDENPGTLRLMGPGLDLSRTITIAVPGGGGANKITNWQLNCGYHSYAYGPYHFADCDCMVGRLAEVHGQISFTWEFGAEPAEILLVTPSRESIVFKTSPWVSYGTVVRVQAAYGDGEPAPLADATQLTFTASSTAYGSLVSEACGIGSGCSIVERGASVSTRYKGFGSRRISYFADGDHGDGSPPATAGPVCDTPVGVTVTGGGLSGGTEVVIRGSSTVTQPDTLIVTASPSVLELGGSATVSVVALTEDGCEVGNALPDSTRMLVAVSSTGQGSLEYGGERAAAFAGVPYGDLRIGQVQFVADSLACDSARVAIAVFAGEDLWGETEIEVRTPENGRTICEAPLPEHDPATKEEIEQLIRATCPGSLPADLGPYFQASVRATLNAAVQGTLGLPYSLPPAPTALPVDGWLNDLRDAATWQIVPGYVTSILEVKFNELRNDPFSGPQYRSHMNDLARAYSVPGTILSGAPLYVIATNSQDSRIGWLGSVYRTSNLTSEAAARRINVMHLRVTRDGNNFYLSGDLIGPKADIQSWIWDLLNDVEHPFAVSCTPEY